MQLQQQQAPRCVHFRPPFAAIGGANITGSTASKHSWLHHSRPKLTVNFSGTWIKDKAASDSMSEAIALMGLGGLIRTAIKLVRGVKIQQDEKSFSMAVFSVFSWFKVSEKYNLDGSVSQCRRRDFRRGGHRGSLEVAGANKLLLNLQWDDPYGGVGQDVITMPSKDILQITSTITVHGKTLSFRSVYNRQS